MSLSMVVWSIAEVAIMARFLNSDKLRKSSAKTCVARSANQEHSMSVRSGNAANWRPINHVTVANFVVLNTCEGYSPPLRPLQHALKTCGWTLVSARLIGVSR